VACSFDHPLRLIRRHFRPRGMRGRCFHRLFQIHQAIIFFVPIHMQQNGVTRTAQRAATFHPIGGVNEFDFFVVIARAQTGGEAAAPRHAATRRFNPACTSGTAITGTSMNSKATGSESERLAPGCEPTIQRHCARLLD
jgi:hypothetical protein